MRAARAPVPRQLGRVDVEVNAHLGVPEHLDNSASYTPGHQVDVGPLGATTGVFLGSISPPSARATAGVTGGLSRSPQCRAV